MRASTTSLQLIVSPAPAVLECPVAQDEQIRGLMSAMGFDLEALHGWGPE